MGCSLGHRLNHNPRMFRVYNVDKSGVARTMGKIEITEEDLILYQKGKEAVCWPLRSLRRYGFDAELFSFESGRRCPTGQGIYAFKCQRAEALFNLLQECIQLAGQQQQQQHHHDWEAPAATGHTPLPPPQLDAWPPDSQLPTYVNREVIDTQHEYVNTSTQNNNGRHHSNGSVPGSAAGTPTLNYAQLDLPPGSGDNSAVGGNAVDAAVEDLTANYVNVAAMEEPRRTSNVSQSQRIHIDAQTVVPPPSSLKVQALPDPSLAAAAATSVPSAAATSSTTPGSTAESPAAATDDVNYIQVEIVSDSAPSSPAATQVITGAYTFPPAPNTAVASGGEPTPPPPNREEKYAIIDFDKTYAINTKSNHDNEGVRKTRHNSNLEDCA